MKNLTFIIGLMLILLNLLFGLILSSYATFNMVANCVVIAVNVLLIWLVGSIQLKDGFRISLSVLFPLFAIVEFMSIAFSRPQLEDNGAVIFVLLAIMLQVILLLGTNYVSKTIQ